MSVAFVPHALAVRTLFMVLRPRAGPALYGSHNHHDGHEGKMGWAMGRSYTRTFTAHTRAGMEPPTFAEETAEKSDTRQRHSAAFESTA